MKCSGCGAEMRFDPATQNVVCDHCGASKDPFFAEEQCRIVEGSHGESYLEAEVFQCPQCGARLLSTDATAITFCSYCGSSVVLEGRLEQEEKPDYIIPFKKTKEEVEKLYKHKVSRALFAPSYMKSDDVVSRFRGIYMPYWVYSMQNADGLRANGKVEERHGDYIYTYSYLVSADYDAEYKGLSYDASSVFSDSLSEAIAPFDVHDRVPFKTAYMSGFYADTRDVKPYVYIDNASEVVSKDIAGKAAGHPSFGIHGATANEVEKSVRLRTDHTGGYFPVWFLATQSRDKSRVSYAVVNGQTGKVAADMPIDFGKYLLGSLILAIPIFLILAFAVPMTPLILSAAVVVIAIASLILANVLLNDVYRRENQLDDEGLQFAQDHSEDKAQYKLYGKFSKEKAPGKIKKTWKVLLGLVVVAAVIFLNTQVRVAATASDMWIYGAAALSMGLNIWTFFDIVKAYNQLTTRKPPQMGARGGDERA